MHLASLQSEKSWSLDKEEAQILEILFMSRVSITASFPDLHHCTIILFIIECTRDDVCL